MSNPAASVPSPSLSISERDAATPRRITADALLGDDRAMQALRRDLAAVARSAAPTVLLCGETGTGKDVAARAVHGQSARRDGPFVAVNCAAIPAALLEDAFFGHDAGAFTDARRARPGLLEEAQGGTLFLDEIGDLDLALQAKLLRVLDERRFRRLGGAERPVDVRVVAATQVDLEAAVEARRFRPDLFHRLDVVRLDLPPLRERRGDVPLLASHFLERARERYPHRLAGFDAESAAMLERHPWPGNVRQLMHAVERAALFGSLDVSATLVEPRMLRLEPRARREGPQGAPGGTAAASAASLAASSAPMASARPSALPAGDLRNADMLAVAAALERADGCLTDAAELLGVTRDTVRQRIKRYGLTVRVQVDLPERPRE